MSQFGRLTSRDQRANVNNRAGNYHFHDNVYNINWSSVDTRRQANANGVLPFQTQGGHIINNERHSYDLHYNDEEAFHRLHNRVYQKGAVEFQKMSAPNHENAHRDLRFAAKSGANAATSAHACGGALYTGEPFTTPTVATAQINNKYAREMGSQKNISWNNMLSRDDRDKGKDRAKAAYSSTKMCGLNVSYKAVDIEADHVVKFDPDGRYTLNREKRIRELRAIAKIRREMEQRQEAEDGAAAAARFHREVNGTVSEAMTGGGGGGASPTANASTRGMGASSSTVHHQQPLQRFRRPQDRLTAYLRPGNSSTVATQREQQVAVTQQQQQEEKPVVGTVAVINTTLAESAETSPATRTLSPQHNQQHRNPHEQQPNPLLAVALGLEMPTSTTAVSIAEEEPRQNAGGVDSPVKPSAEVGPSEGATHTNEDNTKDNKGPTPQRPASAVANRHVSNPQQDSSPLASAGATNANNNYTLYHRSPSLPSHLQRSVNSYNPFTNPHEGMPPTSASMQQQNQNGSGGGVVGTSAVPTVTSMMARPHTASAGGRRPMSASGVRGGIAGTTTTMSRPSSAQGGPARALRPASASSVLRRTGGGGGGMPPPSAGGLSSPHTTSLGPAATVDLSGNDPVIRAFNNTHRVLARNLSFNRAARFGPSGGAGMR